MAADCQERVTQDGRLARLQAKDRTQFHRRLTTCCFSSHYYARAIAISLHNVAITFLTIFYHKV